MHLFIIINELVLVKTLEGYLASIFPLNVVDYALEFPFNQNVRRISIGFKLIELIVGNLVNSNIKLLPDKA